MGQCSSTNKEQRNKQKALEQLDTQVSDEDGKESFEDMVAPKISGFRQHRRAIDECAGRRDEPAKSSRDFCLAAMRASLDNDTCAALLALRMGRGSSAGGFQHIQNVDSGTFVEEGAVKIITKHADGKIGKGHISTTEGLEKLLGSTGISDVARPPQIPPRR